VHADSTVVDGDDRSARQLGGHRLDNAGDDRGDVLGVDVRDAQVDQRRARCATDGEERGKSRSSSARSVSR
jgi:hypothetical protein